MARVEIDYLVSTAPTCAVGKLICLLMLLSWSLTASAEELLYRIPSSGSAEAYIQKGPYFLQGNADGSPFGMRVPAILQFGAVVKGPELGVPEGDYGIRFGKEVPETGYLRIFLWTNEYTGIVDGGYPSRNLVPDVYGYDQGVRVVVSKGITEMIPTPWALGGGYVPSGGVEVELSASQRTISFGETINVVAVSSRGGTVFPTSPSNYRYWVNSPELATISLNGELQLRVNPRTGQQIGIFAQSVNGVGAYLTMTAIDLTGNDADGDGLDDDWEYLYGFDPSNPADALADPDMDGLSNREEAAKGTNPLDSDTDRDGLNDLVDPEPLIPESVPPVVAIVSPVNGGTVTPGQTMVIIVSATDNVRVKAVSLTVNHGAVSLVEQGSGLYSGSFLAPSSEGNVEIAVVARDVAGNSATATSAVVVVPAVADTTITGRIVDSALAPIPGAQVGLSGQAAQVSGSDGRFEFAFTRGQRQSATLLAQATATNGDPLGVMRTVAFPTGGIVNLGDIVLAKTTFVRGRVVGTDGEPYPAALISCRGTPGAVSQADGSYILAVNPDYASIADIVALGGSPIQPLTGLAAVSMLPLRSEDMAPQITLLPPAFDNDLGDRFNPQLHKSIAHPLPFSFPFYGNQYSTVYVNSNGLIGMSPVEFQPYVYAFWDASPETFLAGVPAFAPLHSYINATASFFRDDYGSVTTLSNPDLSVGLYIKDTPQRSSFTWFRVHHSLDDTGEFDTFQAVLSLNGQLRSRYTTPFAGTAYYGTIGVVGITPGGGAAPASAVTVNFSEVTTRALLSGTGATETFQRLVPDFDLGGREITFTPTEAAAYLIQQQPFPSSARTILTGCLMDGQQPRVGVVVNVTGGLSATTDSQGCFVIEVPLNAFAPLNSPKVVSVTVGGTTTFSNVGIFPGVINLLPIPQGISGFVPSVSKISGSIPSVRLAATSRPWSELANRNHR